jgi:hypothetical protein
VNSPCFPKPKILKPATVAIHPARRQFEAGTIPFEHWHHREHIKAAYLYLQRAPLVEAIERMRQSLKALNAAHRVPDDPQRGYHETMTQAWMRVVHETISAHGPAENADAFFARHPQLGDKCHLQRFYSRELLLSAAAKARFVEPDLAPLP